LLEGRDLISGGSGDAMGCKSLLEGRDLISGGTCDAISAGFNRHPLSLSFFH
jgi:hypothetical protein